MIRRRKVKRLGYREVRGAIMDRRSGFAWVASCNRAVLVRRPTRLVSTMGMRGLRWYNITGTKRRALERNLRRNWKRMARGMRKNLPLKMRRPQTFLLY